MSQIASFYLIKEGRRQELSNGDCSGEVYMAIWDWCECELDLDVRFPAPQTEDTLDCALLDRTGTSPPRWCGTDWKRCAPIWSWCRATLPCCMKWYENGGMS